jgi:hypothetical protein
MGCERLQGPTTGFEPRKGRATLARQHQATQSAIEANAGPIAELDKQAGSIRASLKDLDDRIVTEVAAVIAAGFEAEVTAIRAAADVLNARLARMLALRLFCFARGNPVFARLGERIAEHRPPFVGAVPLETEVATADWQHRFEELVA